MKKSAAGPLATRASFPLLFVLWVGGLGSAQATRRIERTTDGKPPDAPVALRGIGGEGRFLLLESAATNLVSEASNGVLSLFVYDVALDRMELVSIRSDGVPANRASQRGRISRNGRFVAFESLANQLVPDDTNAASDIFVHDRVERTTVRVNLNNAGREARGGSFWGSTSDDGRYVAFDSDAENLTPGDSNDQHDVFVRDRDPDGNGTFDEGNGRTVRVSRSDDGSPGNGGSFFPGLSGDGRVVVFHSNASDLVNGDSNGDWDVFVHDRDPDRNGILDEGNGTTSLLSVGTEGVQGNRSSRDAVIDANGRYAAFWSDSVNLIPSDVNGQRDVFVHDLETGVTFRASENPNGSGGNGESRNVSLSRDGRFLVFRSAADNLIDGDTNGQRDLFLLDRDPDSNGTFDEAGAKLRRVSLSAFDLPGNGDHTSPSLASNGRFLAFQSASTNLVPFPNGSGDGVYLRDLAHLRLGRSPERGAPELVLEGAVGQEGATAWLLLSCTGTKPGAFLAERVWIPLLPDRCTTALVARGRVDRAGRARFRPLRGGVLPTGGELYAAALVADPSTNGASGPWTVTGPLRLRSPSPQALSHQTRRAPSPSSRRSSRPPAPGSP